MRHLLFAVLLFPLAALAEVCGPGTELAWDYEQPLPANVDGFRLYANDVEVWAGATLTAQPDLGLVAETKTFYVVAYNQDRESLHSNSVACDFDPSADPVQLVVPVNVRFPN